MGYFFLFIKKKVSKLFVINSSKEEVDGNQLRWRSRAGLREKMSSILSTLSLRCQLDIQVEVWNRLLSI